MLDTHDLTLVISDKPDPERDAVAAAWEAGGGGILRLGRFWDPPSLDPHRVRVYGAETFCQVLAQKLGVTLVSPPDDLLRTMSLDVVKRSLVSATVGQLGAIAFPRFVKSSVPKLIRSRVYASEAELVSELRGLAPSVELLASEVVDLAAEARSWVLDGEVLSIACYEGAADLNAARTLVTAAARDPGVPSSCVIDVGLTHDRGWLVIEANAAWGAGLNGCDAVAAARCIAQASYAAVGV